MKAKETLIKVFIFAPVFFPAVNAGGPVPALLGIIDELSAEDVTIIAKDRDLGAKKRFDLPFQGETHIGESKVIYLNSVIFLNLFGWIRQLRACLKTDVIYFNSIFSSTFSLLPLVILWIVRFKGLILISPRGELAPSALVLGKTRIKKIWLRVLSILLDSSRFQSNVVWIVSSKNERSDVLTSFPPAKVEVVPEKLRSSHKLSKINFSHPDPLEMVLVGRVAPVKGVLRLFESLNFTNLNINLKVAGYLEDPEYVAQLKELQGRLRSNIKIQWLGPLPQEQLVNELINSHIFVSLTFGENFGHSIGESLQLGVPVLISDQTPWTENVKLLNAGFVLTDDECNQPQFVANVITRFTKLSYEQQMEMSENAKRAAQVGSRNLNFSELIRLQLGADKPNLK